MGPQKDTPIAVKVSPLPANDTKIVRNQLTTLTYIITFKNQLTILSDIIIVRNQLSILSCIYAYSSA